MPLSMTLTNNKQVLPDAREMSNARNDSAVLAYLRWSFGTTDGATSARL